MYLTQPIHRVLQQDPNRHMSICGDRRWTAAQFAELTEFCRAHIASYKLPRSIAFVDALPVSGAGKVLKRELRTTHQEGSAV